MASTGRPTERPVHITAEQRRAAQLQTTQWRLVTQLSRAQLAMKLSVAPSTYRQWESGTDQNAGPTQAQATLLDRVLRALLGAAYSDGAALRIWGWPPTESMTYSHVAELLRAAGFDVPNSSESRPAVVVWAHRLNEPNLVHAVFALAAAAATRAGLSVRLLLDDLAEPSVSRPGLRFELETRIRSWFTFAAGSLAQLSVRSYSEILTSDLLAERGWSAVSRYLSVDTEALEFLLASKVVSPTQYSTDAEESVLELLHHNQSVKADRMLTALRNWIVFEQEIGELLVPFPADASVPIVTLGGEDERLLWGLWHRCCLDGMAARVQHIYLTPMPMPSYRAPWLEPALAARADRPTLTTYLRSRTLHDRNFDLIEWVIKAAITLPGMLNQDFGARLEPSLHDIDALLSRPIDDMHATAAIVAKAVVEWLTA